MYLNVIPATKIPIARQQTFTYSLPAFITAPLKVGQIVEIPLHTRKIYGVIASLQKTKPKFPTKPILALHPDNLCLLPYQLKFAKNLADYFLVSVGQIIKLMIPEKAKLRKTKRQAMPDGEARCLASSDAGEAGSFANFTASGDVSETSSLAGFTETESEASCLAPDNNLTLATQEKKIVHEILQQNKQNFLLKTNDPEKIIAELIKNCLKKKKQVLLLLPEIQLTKKIIAFYQQKFINEPIILWHSGLAKGQLYQNWLNTKSIQSALIIGTRSAIFLPFKNLSKIIVASEHDSSFKQWDQAPRYQAREACYQLAKLTQAQLILTSHAPSLDTLYQVKTEKLAFLENNSQHQIEIIDMNKERQAGNYSPLANKTIQILNKIYQKNKQGLIFINHYGSAGVTICRDCGYTVKCPNCQVSLVYYQKSCTGEHEQLLCHYCHYQIPSPTLCPKCQGTHLKSFGVGLEKIESEIKKLWPKIKIDALKAGQNNQIIYENFNQGKLNLILGTQIIKKENFLKKIDYAIIINPDLMLNLADFRAGERAFQVMSEIKNLAHNCLIQTNQTTNPVIKALKNNNDQYFYQQELRNRQELEFPPFSEFIKLIYKHNDQKIALKEAHKLHQQLRKIINLKLKIYPPHFSRPEKIRNKYNIFINLKITDQKLKIKLKKIIPSDWQVDVQPEGLL